MKRITIILVFLSQNLLAAEAGRLTMSGEGCGSQRFPGTLPNLSENSHKAVIPFFFKLEKSADNKIGRKACNLAWPIKLNKKEKVQISNIQQDVLLTHSQGTLVKANLSLFFAGAKKTKDFKAELTADEKSETLQKIWNEDSFFMESGCGKDTIFRGNFNANVTGDSTGAAESESLKFNIKIVPCE